MLHVISLANPVAIDVVEGDIVRAVVSFEYRGKAQDLTLYGSIGSRGTFGFDEVLVGKANISVPESVGAFTLVEASVDIRIVVRSTFEFSGTSPGIYDLYVKIEEHPNVMDEASGCINVIGGAGIGGIGSIISLVIAVIMIGIMTKVMGGEGGEGGLL